MASKIDLSKFTFEGELLTAMNQLAYDKILKNPELNELVTIYPNILINKEIGFIGAGQKVGKADAGCSSSAQAYGIASRVLEWTPKRWKVYISECYTNLDNTIASFAFKKGLAISDLTGTDYMEILTTQLIEDLKGMFFRLSFFGDTSALNVTDGGVLTNGVDKTFFTLIDGFFKQMITQCTVNPAQLVTITENAGATYALQALPKTSIEAYLDAAIYGAPMALRQTTDAAIYATQSVYDALEQALTGKGIEGMYVALLSGMKAIKYRGVNVIAVPQFDAIIRADEDNGTTWNNPHRFIYTSKEVLGVGVDDTTSFSELKVWYDEKDEQTYVKARGEIDAKVMNPDLFVLGYGAIGS